MIKKYLLLSLFVVELLYSSLSTADIHYYIQYKDNKLHVLADFGYYGKFDESDLYIPDTIWGTNYTKQLNNIMVRNGHDNQKNSRKFINRFNNLLINYDVLNLPLEEFQDSFADRYYHYYTNNKFYLIGHGLFIYPKGFKERVQETVVIHFDTNYYSQILLNIPPYKLDKNNSITLNLGDLNDLVIVGNSSISNASGQTALITWPAKFNKGKHISSLISSIIKKQDKFWGVHAKNKTIVIINDPETSRTNHYGGTWLKDTIILFTDSTTNSDEDLVNIISHENLHSWFGNNGIINGTQWFREGFTSYYVDKIAYKLNKNYSAFVDNYNYILYLYFSSPFRDLSDKVTEEFFFKISALERLPYWKGYLIAGQIDSIIDLDSLLRGAFKDCRNSAEKCLFSYDFLVKYLPSNATEHDKKQINKIINNFSDKSLVERFIAEKGKLSYKQELLEDFPFDIEKALIHGLIAGKYFLGDGRHNREQQYRLDNIWNNPKGVTYISILNEGLKKDIKLNMKKVNTYIPFYQYNGAR